jgi:hypothetical protein
MPKAFFQVEDVHQKRISSVNTMMHTWQSEAHQI